MTICPSCPPPGLLIPKKSSRGNWFFPVLRRQWWTRVWRMAFLPVCVKVILTWANCLFHPSIHLPRARRSLLGLVHTICTALQTPYLGALNQKLWGLSPSPAQSACPCIRVHESHLQAAVTLPRVPGAAPRHLRMPGRPCQVAGAGLLGSHPSERWVLSVTFWDRVLPLLSVLTWAGVGASRRPGLPVLRGEGVPQSFLPVGLPGRTEECS